MTTNARLKAAKLRREGRRVQVVPGHIGAECKRTEVKTGKDGVTRTTTHHHNCFSLSCSCSCHSVGQR